MPSGRSPEVHRYARLRGSRDRPGLTPGALDRLALLRSIPLRRLAGVTQVIDPAKNARFDTRLSHTLKVASVARELATILLERHRYHGPHMPLDPDVVEAAALVHDLGHPPFGHIGEAALNRALKIRGVPEGFNANAQSFRIVTRLAAAPYRAGGLDLTRATLDASLKYPFTFTVDRGGTFGVYLDDLNAYRWVRETDGDVSPSLEADLVDWADEIAYTVYDLLDFYHAGLVPLRDLTRDTRAEHARAEAIARIVARLGTTPTCPSPVEVERHLRVLDELLLWSDRGERRPPPHVLDDTGRYLLERYLSGTAIVFEDKVRMEIATGLRQELRVLLELVRAYAFTKDLQAQQHEQAHLIENLFAVVSDAALGSRESHLHQLLSTSHDLGTLSREQRLRVVADVLSGMTESEIRQLHTTLAQRLGT